MSCTYTPTVITNESRIVRGDTTITTFKSQRYTDSCVFIKNQYKRDTLIFFKSKKTE